ncbi:14113_t:CDS:2, partial [Funneliformis geosporum]
MRQGELIHSSQGCEDLIFHDPDDYWVVPQSQLVISRQAFRNNAS